MHTHAIKLNTPCESFNDDSAASILGSVTACRTFDLKQPPLTCHDTGLMAAIPNVLAERYASAEMKNIWSATGRIVLEREFWIAVMEAQRDLGIDIPAEAIEAYKKVKNTVDLEAIRQRETITRHDVKARIETFCDLAGHEHIHKGMTSRDLTENVEQLQVARALELVRERTVAALALLGERAQEFRDLVITGRTHNVAAQITTFGKRIACFGEEMRHALEALNNIIEAYPVRGLKGAVGTQLDALTLLEGDTRKVDELEKRIVKHLGFSQSILAVGQVYPRSYDYEVASVLFQLASGPSSLARTLRLMAGHETASEGFAKGQVGSSAMPHKMNSRSCERINGFHSILRGYATMLSGLAGDQWNEGDVSCSVVRRVALPDAFFAMDGLLETLLTVLQQMDAYPAVIESENEHYLPFLLTTTFMMEAVKNGVGRETAHEVIKEHAVATVQDLRTRTVNENDLAQRLADDDRLKLSEEQVADILARGRENTGAASTQVDAFVASIEPWKQRFPNAVNYRPKGIL